MAKILKKQASQDHVKFGLDKISVDSKRKKILKLFNSISSNYDKMNDIMSLRSHRLWKKDLVERIEFFRFQKNKKFVLDLAGGTGDIAFLIRKRWPNNHITIYDLSLEMLNVGIKKSKKKGFTKNLSWMIGDSAYLPFKESCFDIITCAFGIRNICEIEKTLSESFRILKPGGKLLVLEFSPDVINPFKNIYNFYLKKIIPKMGKEITNNMDAYQYLCDSILTFYKPKVFSKMIEDNGFQKIKIIKYLGGIACLYIAFRI